jgi:hypothetical protein
MKFSHDQEITLISDTFNFIRCDGVISEPPKFGKVYKLSAYVPKLFRGKVIFWLHDFPSGMMFFEDTFEVVPSIKQVAKDLGDIVQFTKRK